MKTSICETMKKAALLSVIFIIAGIFFEILAQLPESASLLSVIVSYLGFFSIFMGFIVMIITAIVLMFPKINKQLDACQH